MGALRGYTVNESENFQRAYEELVERERTLRRLLAQVYHDPTVALAYGVRTPHIRLTEQEDGSFDSELVGEHVEAEGEWRKQARSALETVRGRQ